MCILGVEMVREVEPYGICLDCGETYPLPEGWVSGVYGLCPRCARRRRMKESRGG